MSAPKPITGDTLGGVPIKSSPTLGNPPKPAVGDEVVFPLRCKVIRHMTSEDGSTPLLKLQAVLDDPAFRSFAVPVDAVDPVK